MKRETLYLLGELGDNWKTVAKNLTMLGCKGDSKFTTCPVAVYLRRHDISARVCNAWARVYDKNRVLHEVTLPLPVAKFVTTFDGGDFPELELP